MKINIPHQTYAKQLVKIIHQKQKQIDRYRHIIKAKQNKPELETAATWSLNLTAQTFHSQISENRKYIKDITLKLKSMQLQIQHLQNGLYQQQLKNSNQQQEIRRLRVQLSSAKHQIEYLQQKKQLQCQTIQEIDSNKTIESKQLNQLKQTLAENINEIKNLKQIINIRQNMDKQFFNVINTIFNKLQLKQTIQQQWDRDIKHIYKSSNYNQLQSYYSKSLNMLVSLINNVMKLQYQFNKKQSSIQLKLEQNLVEQSIDLSIFLQNSRKICESIEQNTLFLKQQEQLLKNLEEQMKKDIQISLGIQNQKIVQLNQAKQSLKMTKQVNQQLFIQIERLQKIVQQCKIQVIKLIQKDNLKDNKIKDKLIRILSIQQNKK